MESTQALVGGWPSHVHPVWRRTLWSALLVAASLTLTLGFACAIPFAALGTAAALTLARREALAVTVAIWLANQAAGYLVLQYPRTPNSVAWAIAMVAAAIAATLTADAVARRLHAAGHFVRTGAALAGSYAVFEALIFAAALQLGGMASLALPIVGWILLVNALTLSGLYAIYQVAEAITLRRSAHSPLNRNSTGISTQTATATGPERAGSNRH